MTLPPDIEAALARYAAELCEPGTTREEAIIEALRDYLTGQGLLPIGDDD